MSSTALSRSSSITTQTSVRRKPVPSLSADDLALGASTPDRSRAASPAFTSGVVPSVHANDHASTSREVLDPSTEHSFPPRSSAYAPPSATSMSSAPNANIATHPNVLPSTTLTSGPSIHSHRSSIAPESVFGTAPVGVIGKHRPREIVRVERDYSAGELCQFWSGWVWELEGRISPTDFQNTLNELNTVLLSAHDPYKSAFDNCFAVLTLYMSPHILGSHYEREMDKFEKILERANREIYNPAGLNILSPRRTAFLFLEIEYY
ncbi:hypothetical protein MNV49_000914 [Pseudohyphozyma bogoriensis]|nr:hypothetical protein MNV49_000914 [Pseudohyphozyma bogoriensis]